MTVLSLTYSVEVFLMCFLSVAISSNVTYLDAAQWCAYLQDNPREPDLILYNRIPKTGSSTLGSLFETLPNIKTVPFKAIKTGQYCSVQH